MYLVLQEIADSVRPPLSPLLGCAFVVGAAAFALLAAVARWVPMPPGPSGRLIILLCAASTLGALIALGSTWLWRRNFRRFLRQRLTSLGIPVCIHCGYALRAQTEPPLPNAEGSLR